MASFVSALDQPHASAASPHETEKTVERLRDCLRFLRHVEGVEISGMSYNWDALKCFVIYVTVTDDEVEGEDDARVTGIKVIKPTAPFQIERTPKELQQLEMTMRQWSGKHSARDAACAFCQPIANGDATAAAKASAGEAPSRGFLSSVFRRSSSRLKSGDEWEAWLNASISRMRRVEIDEETMCEGLLHVPALLSRFLLQEFASDIIL